MKFCRIFLFINVMFVTNLFAFEVIPGQTHNTIEEATPKSNKLKSQNTLEQIAELKEKLSEIESSANNSSTTNNDSAENSPKIKDENFKIITEIQDKLRELFRENEELLKIVNLSETSTSAKILKALVTSCGSSISNKKIIEDSTSAVDDFAEIEENANVSIQSASICFFMLNLLVNGENSLISYLNKMNHSNVITQSSAISITEMTFSPILIFIPELCEKQVKDTAAFALKAFETFIKVPSSLMFCIMNSVRITIAKVIEETNQRKREFSRISEKLTNNLKNLVAELHQTANSQETAPNLVPLIESNKNLISSCIETCSVLIKSTKENMEKTLKSLKKSSDILSPSENYAADPKILDIVESN